MTSPIPYLVKGDLIQIISTARKITLEEVEPAKNILESWGFKVAYGENLFKSHNQYAGTDEERLNDFQSAIDNPKVKAVLCARGGYGTLRIIDDINWNSFLKTPKWIVGFSDITVLHLHLNTLNIPSIHATMPILFEQKGNENALTTLKNTLFGKSQDVQFPFQSFNTLGEIKGEIIGGNLSIINQLIGTPSFPDLNEKILFIEDLDEYLYHIDRMMYQLKRAGVFSKIKGLIIGHMSEMNDNTVPFGKSALEIIKEHTQEYDFPIAFNCPIGHQANNQAVVCGKEIMLSVSQKGSLLSYI